MESYAEINRVSSDLLENSLETLTSYIKESCELNLKTSFLWSAEKSINNTTVVSCVNTFKIDNIHNCHLILNIENNLLSYLLENLSLHTTSTKNMQVDSSWHLLQKLTNSISEGIVSNFRNEIRLITSNKRAYLHGGFLADCLLKHKTGSLHFYLIRFIPV